MARIENHKYTIHDAFKECFYVVPDYQREYVWSEKQITQLLEDINEQIDSSSSEYFIGTILVSQRDGEKGHYDVIDGQQRLTTTFLILCALRALFNGLDQERAINDLTIASYTDPHGDIKTNLKLEPRYENAGEVIEKIVQTNGDPQAVRTNIRSSGIHIFGSVENILNAYDVIYHFITENYNDEAKLKKYWGHLANNVVFIQISTDVSSALKIFETINERGVGLNPMDLLKNLLFTQVLPERFSQLKDEWKKITSPLEKNKEKPLRFLRYFLMANYDIKNERSDAIVREDEIYDWFSKKKNAALTGYQDDPFKFVRQITRNVSCYVDFSNGRGNDGKNNEAMVSLKKLTGGAFSLHYVLLLAAANLPKHLFDQFVAQLESFLFFYIFTKTPTKDLERNFSLWADDVRSITNLGNKDEQRKKLNDFVSKRFAQNMDDKKNELNDALNRLTLHSMQQYRIRYLLVRLTQHVEMAFIGKKDGVKLDHFYDLEIEHILPNKPGNSLRETWQKQHPDLIYDEHKSRLGNLSLLEKPINIVAGNDFYAAKRNEYAKSGNYLTRSLSALAEVGQNTSISRINEKLSAFDKWDAESIEQRQQLLIGLVHEIWIATEITADT
ncbi:MAG: DUF262 domain-containing HNH endonuclease family protein [Hyphomicrobiales bacterium]